MAGRREYAGVGIIAVEDDRGGLMHGQKLVDLAPDPRVPSGIIYAGVHLRREVLERIAELLENGCSLAESNENRLHFPLQPARNCNQPSQMTDTHAVR